MRSLKEKTEKLVNNLNQQASDGDSEQTMKDCNQGIFPWQPAYEDKLFVIFNVELELLTFVLHIRLVFSIQFQCRKTCFAFIDTWMLSQRREVTQINTKFYLNILLKLVI